MVFNVLLAPLERAPVTILRKPDHTAPYCDITLRISWDFVDKFTAIIRPFSAALIASGESRTEHEIAMDLQRIAAERAHAERKRLFYVKLRGLIRRIYREGLSAHDFGRFLWGHEYGRFMSKKDARALYSEARKRCARRMKKSGRTTHEIAEKFGVCRATASKLLNG